MNLYFFADSGRDFLMRAFWTLAELALRLCRLGDHKRMLAGGAGLLDRLIPEGIVAFWIL